VPLEKIPLANGPLFSFVCGKNIAVLPAYYWGVKFDEVFYSELTLFKLDGCLTSSS